MSASLRTLPLEQGPPDLILVTGHGSHWLGLQIRYRLGGKLVVLLKPSFPLWLFDLCIIPRHDQPPLRGNVMLTLGTINDVQASTVADPARGLILVGGPSRNHDWSGETMLEQLRALVRATPDVHWTLSDSARTPPEFLAAAADLREPRVDLVSHRDTDRPWLMAQLQTCGRVWVSEDSASMVYEALTAGARVGVLDVPRKGSSRVSRGLDQLIAEGRLKPSSAIDHDATPNSEATRPIQEAARVAAVLDQWLRSGERPPATQLHRITAD